MLLIVELPLDPARDVMSDRSNGHSKDADLDILGWTVTPRILTPRLIV